MKVRTRKVKMCMKEGVRKICKENEEQGKSIIKLRKHLREIYCQEQTSKRKTKIKREKRGNGD